MGSPVFFWEWSNNQGQLGFGFHGIRDQLELVRPTLPDGIEMVVNYDESNFVEDSIREVWFTLAFAFLLVVTVIYVFLHNFRATGLVPAVAILFPSWPPLR